ncbi:MAG: 6,7-dimethyl-8-ribityllumazine synthase [Legionellaceae bacterium]|nr:6,7-dimethyl-8-ribityllumazine synthase [Legionellaceae bacterium]
MKHIQANLGNNRGSFPIAIIVSLFNRDLTEALQRGAVDRLLECGFSKEHITLVEVPGAIEIPFMANKLAKTQQYNVIIALGVVIRGETTHYDYVCERVSEGCQRVALDYDTPVIFGVLTTENDSQAWDRLGGKHGHKGTDAADAALAMHHVLQRL